MLSMVLSVIHLGLLSHHDGVKCLMNSFRLDSLLTAAEPKTVEPKRVTGRACTSILTS